VFDDLQNDVALTACLAYQASEDPTLVARDRRVMPINRRTGQLMQWPQPVEPERAGQLKK
jgi:hypothetical protein